MNEKIYGDLKEFRIMCLDEGVIFYSKELKEEFRIVFDDKESISYLMGEGNVFDETIQSIETINQNEESIIGLKIHYNEVEQTLPESGEYYDRRFHDPKDVDKVIELTLIDEDEFLDNDKIVERFVEFTFGNVKKNM